MNTASNTPAPYTDDEIRAACAYLHIKHGVDYYLSMPGARKVLEHAHRDVVSVEILFADSLARCKQTAHRVPFIPPVPVGLDGHPMRQPQPIFKGRPFDGADPEPGFLFHNPA